MKEILGKKVGMTQVFDETGQVVPVTVIQAGPCYVTQIKTPERDGYTAIQLGFEETREKRLTRAERGHLKKPLPPLRHLREVRTSEVEGYEVGQTIDVSIFSVGDLVDVAGVSKGKGFAGVVKRHHFAGGVKTHGQSDRQRAPGAIGATTSPGRVLKGLRMAGHMGSERVTVQKLTVVQVDPERNLLLVKGSVPGGENSLLLIKESVKTRIKKKKR